MNPLENFANTVAETRHEWCANMPSTSIVIDTVKGITTAEATLPLAALFAAFFTALTIFFQVMRLKAKADEADARAQLNEQLRILRDRQQAHQADSADVLAELEALTEMRDEEALALRDLKHRCARRIAFERHLRAVNFNIEQEAAELRNAFEFAASDMTGRSDADIVYSRPTVSESVDASLRDSNASESSCEENVYVTADDTTPARLASTQSKGMEATPASTVRSSQLGQSPAERFEDDPRRRVVDPEVGSALIGVVAQAAADALRAVQRRDGAMAELHIAERDAELIEATFHEVLNDHSARLEDAQRLLAEARRTISTEMSPELRRRAAPLTNGLDAAVDVITEADVAALPFDPTVEENVCDLERECDEMEQENADLLGRITEGYQEMDRLMELAMEQEAVIQSLDAEFEHRDACDAFGAGGVDRAPPMAEEMDTADLPVEEFRHRSQTRASRLRDETKWLQHFTDHVVQRLHGEMDRLSAARHEIAELTKEDEAEEVLRNAIHEQIEHLEDYYYDGTAAATSASPAFAEVPEGDVTKSDLSSTDIALSDSDAATAAPMFEATSRHDHTSTRLDYPDCETPLRPAPAPSPASGHAGTPAARATFFSPQSAAAMRAPPSTPAHDANAEDGEMRTPLHDTVARGGFVEMPSALRAPKSTPVHEADLTPAARQGFFSPVTEQRGPRNTPKVMANLTPAARQEVFSPYETQEGRGPRATPNDEADLTPAARQEMFSPYEAQEGRAPRGTPLDAADLTPAAREAVFSPTSAMRVPMNSAVGTPASGTRQRVASPLSERRAPPASPASGLRPTLGAATAADSLFSPSGRFSLARVSSGFQPQSSTPLSAVKMSSARFNAVQQSSTKKACPTTTSSVSRHCFTSPTANVVLSGKKPMPSYGGNSLANFGSPDNFLLSDRKPLSASVSPAPAGGRRSVVMMRDPLLENDEESFFFH